MNVPNPYLFGTSLYYT